MTSPNDVMEATSEIELEKAIDIAWRALPHTHAQVVSSFRWKPYPYLAMIGDAIVDAVMGGGGFIVVNLPPRHGKSEFISYHVPMWYLDTWPDRNVILASYGAALAEGFSKRVRNAFLGESDKTLTKVRQDSQAANDWQTLEGGGMIAAGVGGAITGKGGHLIIIDDPVKDWEEADSEVIQQRNIDWFRTVLWPRREPGAVIVLLMTRWHKKDLAGFVLSDDISAELSSKPKLFRFPAIAESSADLLNRMPGDALCPERYNLEALREIRAVEGPRHWAGLYQQSPTDDASALVKQHWFQYYQFITFPFRSYITIDMAYGQKQSSDFLVIMNTRLDHHGNIYVWEYIRARLAIKDFINALFAMIERTKALDAVGLEIPAGETEENSAIIRLIKAEMAHRNVYFMLRPVKPKKDKQTRATGFIHKLANGKVWLRKGMTALEDELLSFPTGDHDDMVDTLSQLDEVMKPMQRPQLHRPRVQSWMSV